MRCLFLILSFLYGFILKAQDTIALKPATIKGDQVFTKFTGSSLMLIDSITLKINAHNSLQYLLQSETGAYIKNYGSFSYLNIRGTSSQQNKVLWHGINFQNLSLGAVDYSLIPACLIDEIKIQSAGSGIACGDGALGGCFLLQTNLPSANGFKIHAATSYGSFSKYFSELKIVYRNKKYLTQTTYFNSRAKNNFKFLNTTKYNTPNQEQNNASEKWQGFITEHKFILNKLNTLHFFSWFTESQKEIAPAMSQTASTAHQYDKKLIVGFEYSLHLKKSKLSITPYILKDAINYYNPEVKIASLSNANTLATNIDYNNYIKSWLTVFGGGTFSKLSAEVSDGYLESKNQFRGNVFAGTTVQFNSIKTTVEIIVRNEWSNLTSSGNKFSAGVEKKILEMINLRAKISDNYRFPTFNDLYWSIGGNPNLLAEKGVMREVGIDIDYSFLKSTLKNKLLLTQNFTYYNGKINNWIMWLPLTSSYWSPVNVLKVNTHGIELKSGLNLTTQTIKTSIQLIYANTITKPKENILGDNQSINKQVPYVPRNKTITKLSINYKTIGVGINLNYTGKRFITTDEKYNLPEVILLDAFVSYKLLYRQTACSIQFQCFNISNKSYQWVANHAMPGRFYQVGISISQQLKSN